MKVLVTGASGFVGRPACAALLADGHQLAVVLRDPTAADRAVLRGIRAISGDLAAPGALAAKIRRFSPDAVLHLAWSGIPDFSPAACKANVDASIAFLNLLVQEPRCRKWLISGTCAEYAPASGRRDEDSPLHAANSLSWAKQAIHRYAARLSAKNGADLFWFRLFYVYGPGQRPGSLIPSLASAFRSGTPPSLRTPDAANDFVHVRDVAEAFRAALDPQARPGVYNIGGGTAVTIRKVCRIIERSLTGRDTFSRGLPRAPGKTSRPFWAGLAKARRDLHWRPRTPLVDGILDYLASLPADAARGPR